MSLGGAVIEHWLVYANPLRDRAAELLWIVDEDLQDAVESDIRVHYREDPDLLDGPAYFSRAFYTPAYDGVVRAFFRAQAAEEAQNKDKSTTSNTRPQPAMGGNGSPRNQLPPHLRNRNDVRVVEPTKAGIMNSDLAAIIEMK